MHPWQRMSMMAHSLLLRNLMHRLPWRRSLCTPTQVPYGNILSDKEAAQTMQNLGKEDRHQLEVIKLHHDTILHCIGNGEDPFRIPVEMTDAMWLFILQYCNKNLKDQVNGFQFLHAMQLKNLKRKKELSLKDEDYSVKECETPPRRSTSRILLPNSHFWARHATQQAGYKMCHSYHHGSHLVLDFQFATTSPPMAKAFPEHLHSVFLHCMRDPDPFHVNLCNFPTNLKFEELIAKRFTLKGLASPWDMYPMSVNHVSYLDMYPKDKLVYITKESPNTLEVIDPNIIYILPVWNKSAYQPAAEVQALRDGLQTVSLPFEQSPWVSTS